MTPIKQFPAYMTDVTAMVKRGFTPTCPSGYNIGQQDLNANTTSRDLVYLCTKADGSGAQVVQDVEIIRGLDQICPPLFSQVPVNLDSDRVGSPPVYLCKKLVDAPGDFTLPGS
jgi:hypothetical protein